MSYWRLPAEGADDPDEAARWGRLALEAGGPCGEVKEGEDLVVARRVRSPESSRSCYLRRLSPAERIRNAGT